MGSKRKQHSAQYKEEVAMAVLAGGKTLAAPASGHGVHEKAMGDALLCPSPAILLGSSFFNSGKIKSILRHLAQRPTAGLQRGKPVPEEVSKCCKGLGRS